MRKVENKFFIMKFIRRVINDLENSKTPFIYFILNFIFIVALRNLIEPLSTHSTISPMQVIHFSLAYITYAATFILLLYAFTKTEVLKIAKVVLSGFIIIILPPLLDLILSRGKGWPMTYLLPGIHGNLGLRFITFNGNFSGIGITPGLRIEGALTLIGIFIYLYVKNSKIIKSLLGTFSAYVVFFFYTTVPFIIKYLLFFNKPTFSYSDYIFSNFYLLIITLEGIALVYLAKKEYLKLIIADIRSMIWRGLHYILMPILGFILAKYYYPGFSFFVGNNLFYVISLPLSIFFALLFSLSINNMEDLGIDKISNQDRPLAAGKISFAEYKKLLWVFLFISLFYAALINFRVLLTIIAFIGIYFLYSAPPFRLKRVPIFSKFLIALNSLILVNLGYILVAGSTSQFPKIVIVIFLVGFTLTINFIDIKDYEGDKKSGIKTLPVILGLQKSKFVIGLIFFLAYLGTGLILKSWYMILIFLILGALEFYLVARKAYREVPVFQVYLYSLIIVIFYLIHLIPLHT